jgi:hypothetical protein
MPARFLILGISTFLLGACGAMARAGSPARSIPLLDKAGPHVIAGAPVVIELRGLSEDVRRQLQEPDSAVQLKISGIRLPRSLGTTVRVYLGKPDATTATPEDIPEYLGYFSLVPMANPSQEPINSLLDITKKARLLAAAGPLTLTFVPEGAEPSRPETGQFSFESIQLRFEPIPGR